MPISPPTASDLAAFRALRSVEDLAALLGVTKKALDHHLYSWKRPRYRHFELAKASGGRREISSPPPVLREFQRKLLSCITALIPPKPGAHGFSLGRSVVTNAQGHVGARLILNIDLLNFFPTINFGRVRGVFMKHPFKFTPAMASILAHIACDDKRLPQGAATSPIISNLVCRGLDRDLSRIADRYDCCYSRYCDDITFSTMEDAFPDSLIAPLSGSHEPKLALPILNVIADHGFEVNPSKTRMRSRRERQEVTGLVVNEKVNVPRRFVRNIRSILRDCEVKGVEAANQRFCSVIDRKQRKGDSPSLNTHLLGKLAFLRMVRGSCDPIYLRLSIRAVRVLDHVRPVALNGPPALTTEFLRYALWVLIGKVGDEIKITGTAISLDAIGIVTASHVFEKEACSSFELRPAHDPTLSYPVIGIKSKQDRDLAIVESEAKPLANLRRSGFTFGPQAPITLAGFPAWLSNDSLLVESGKITQTREIAGLRYLAIDRTIREGNSGGPILSADGEVVGIAIYDSSAATTPNSAISIQHIDALASEPSHPPFG